MIFSNASFFRRIGSAFALIALLAQPVFSQDYPNQVSLQAVQMSRLSTPMNLVFDNPVNNTKSIGVQPFLAHLDQTTCYQGQCIPASTLFMGQVIQVKKSRRFLRPGLIAIQIQKVQFPDGSQVAFKPSGHNLITVRNKGAMTMQRFFFKETAEAIPGILLGMFLKDHSNMSNKQIAKTLLATDLVVDSLQEIVMPSIPDSSIPQRVGMGILSTFYVPDVISVLRRDKDISIHEGRIMPLHIPRNVVKSLFTHVAMPEIQNVTEKCAPNPVVALGDNAPLPINPPNASCKKL